MNLTGMMQQLGISVNTLANDLGVGKVIVQRWMNGKAPISPLAKSCINAWYIMHSLGIDWKVLDFSDDEREDLALMVKPMIIKVLKKRRKSQLEKELEELRKEI